PRLLAPRTGTTCPLSHPRLRLEVHKTHVLPANLSPHPGNSEIQHPRLPTQ
ncbi:phospholipid-translocating P-type ATPase, partial [Diplocarpon rosae]